MPSTPSSATPAACGPGKPLGCQGRVAFGGLIHSKKLTDTSSKLLSIIRTAATIPKVMDLRLWRSAYDPSFLFFFSQNRDLESKKEAWSVFFFFFLICSYILQATMEQRASWCVPESELVPSFPIHLHVSLFFTFCCPCGLGAEQSGQSEMLL